MRWRACCACVTCRPSRMAHHGLMRAYTHGRKTKRRRLATARDASSCRWIYPPLCGSEEPSQLHQVNGFGRRSGSLRTLVCHVVSARRDARPTPPMMATAQGRFGRSGWPDRLAGVVTLRPRPARGCSTVSLGRSSWLSAWRFGAEQTALSDATGLEVRQLRQPGQWACKMRLAASRTGALCVSLEAVRMRGLPRFHVADGIAGRSRVPHFDVCSRAGADGRHRASCDLILLGGRGLFVTMFPCASARGCKRASGTKAELGILLDKLSFEGVRCSAVSSHRPRSEQGADGVANPCRKPAARLAPRTRSKPSRW